MKKTRIVLFTGKGGVGKTTISAATALRAAELGYKTLVMSTDPAHSLADALDKPLTPEPIEVAPNLYGQELDVYYSLRKYWSSMRELVTSIFRWQGADKALAEEMAVLPGMEEISAFLWLEQFYDEGDYDLIVIDSAPTGETLKHLSMPQVSQWWLTRALPVQRLAAQPFSKVFSAVTRIPVDKALQELDTFYRKVMRVHEILTKPETASIRLVLNPERMVLQEALRAYTYLQLYGYPVDAVMVNRVLPESFAQAGFGEQLEAQRGYLAEIEDSFTPLPIFKMSHQGHEVFGLDRLRAIAANLYGDCNPRDSFSTAEPYQFIEQPNGYLLSIHLPFLKNEDVTVTQKDDELIIQAKDRRRNLFLPKFLALYKVTNSQMMDDRLLVRFEKKK
ncbi:MAG: ArsA family ATPase [Anaerolineaceae bacterium]|nr:ArsA family ATPase [Anaerolineaceae bacterium]